MKKVLSFLLCAVVAFSGVVTANAAQTEKEIKKHKGFEVLEDSFVMPNNTMRLIKTVEDLETDKISNYYILRKISEDNNSTRIRLDFSENLNEYKDIEIEPDKYYSEEGINTFDSTQTGGLYKKVKIKLSEFRDCFNDQGYIYEKYFLKTYLNYKLNKYEENGYIASSFAVYSGAYIKRTIPDENGEIEVYVHTNVGEEVRTLVEFNYCDGKSKIGEGIYVEVLDKLTFGNVDGSDYVDVNDVTFLQLYLAGRWELDELGLFNADTNCDGIYDVKDVTHLQLGIVSLKG